MSTRRDFLSAGLLSSVAGFASVPGVWAQPETGSPKGLSYRVLGKTGLKPTSVGFGCMVTSDASVIARAADMGISYFDTCRNYQHGNNERLVATGLQGKRQNIILSSKTDGGTKEAALAELDTSLRELSTDHLDIWYLHEKNSPNIPDELFEAQHIARQQGKIRFMGVSTHNAKELVPYLVKKGSTEVVLATYNFTMDKDVSAAMAQADAAGMGVVAMKVMAGGFQRSRPGDPNIAKLKRDGAMLAALKWALKDPFVHTTIPGITDNDQLEENLKAMTEPYSPHEEKPWPSNSSSSGLFIAACAGSATATAPRACPWPTWCATRCTRMSTASSNWAATTSGACRRNWPRCAAETARPARWSVPMA